MTNENEGFLGKSGDAGNEPAIAQSEMNQQTPRVEQSYLNGGLSFIHIIFKYKTGFDLLI